MYQDSDYAIQQTPDKPDNGHSSSAHEGAHCLLAYLVGAQIEWATASSTLFTPTRTQRHDSAILFAGAVLDEQEMGCLLNDALSGSDCSALDRLCPDPEERAAGLALARDVLADPFFVRSCVSLGERLAQCGKMDGVEIEKWLNGHARRESGL
jgi:hypothetical protein